MTLLAFAQALLTREMRAGLERKYRVAVTQETGDRYAYRLRARIVAPKLPKGAAKVGSSADLRLDLRLTDYRATTQGQKTNASFIGGGEMALDPNGLPNGLNVTGPQGPVWLPLLSFYLPQGEGAFEMSHVPVGSGLEMAGKGTLSSDKEGAQIELAATLVAAGRTFGKLTISTKLDKAGWPEKATGTFVSADGTYQFTLQRG